MAVCGRCGSIRVRVMARRGLSGILSALTGRDMLTCGRCGWEGRAARPPSSSREGGPSRRRRSKKNDQPTEVVAPPTADLDLTALDRSLDDEKAS